MSCIGRKIGLVDGQRIKNARADLIFIFWSSVGLYLEMRKLYNKEACFTHTLAIYLELWTLVTTMLHLAPGKALFVFVNNTLPQTTSLIETVYESSKDKDGFLYMCYSSEKTFGGHS
uniref:Autophagy-related protein n=1 Tax=Solanum lycopersicum TaxID=4081 RepID=A0A3Q7EG83_SOLLC